MLLAALVVGGASAYAGNDFWRSLAFGAGSLFLMQVGYFGAILILVLTKGDTRD